MVFGGQRNKNINFRRSKRWVDPEGGGGGAVGLDPPPEKSQNIGFPSNINLDNLNSQDNQASIQCWAIIGMPVKCHFNGASLADR